MGRIFNIIFHLFVFIAVQSLINLITIITNRRERKYFHSKHNRISESSLFISLSMTKFSDFTPNIQSRIYTIHIFQMYKTNEHGD